MVFGIFPKTGRREKYFGPRAKMEFSVLIREPRWPKLFMNIKYYELGFYHKNFKWKRVRELFLPAQSFGLRQAEIFWKRMVRNNFDKYYFCVLYQRGK